MEPNQQNIIQQAQSENNNVSRSLPQDSIQHANIVPQTNSLNKKDRWERYYTFSENANERVITNKFKKIYLIIFDFIIFFFFIFISIVLFGASTLVPNMLNFFPFLLILLIVLVILNIIYFSIETVINKDLTTNEITIQKRIIFKKKPVVFSLSDIEMVLIKPLAPIFYYFSFESSNQKILLTPSRFFTFGNLPLGIGGMITANKISSFLGIPLSSAIKNWGKLWKY